MAVRGIMKKVLTDAWTSAILEGTGSDLCIAQPATCAIHIRRVPAFPLSLDRCCSSHRKPFEQSCTGSLTVQFKESRPFQVLLENSRRSHPVEVRGIPRRRTVPGHPLAVPVSERAASSLLTILPTTSFRIGAVEKPPRRKLAVFGSQYSGLGSQFAVQ